MKDELKILHKIIDGVIRRHENMLSKFHPCQPGKGEFLEQNLITNFAIEFVTKFPEANVYTEVPFQCKDKDSIKEYWKCRADLFIINGDKGYIIEAKGSQKGEKLFELIEADIKRINSVKNSFLKMIKDQEKFPTKMFGVIIADFWGTQKEKEKIESNQFINRWNNNEFNEKDFPELKGITKFPAKDLSSVSEKYPYWFLAGMFQLDWNNNFKENS